MPFAYYGAKHGLAPKYPRPQHRVIVEPFAGSAAYSVHHAAHVVPPRRRRARVHSTWCLVPDPPRSRHGV